MFYVHEEVETYEGGFENYKTETIECATHDEAIQEFENRAAAHIEAGHDEMFKMHNSACYADFNGGKYAVASYNIFIQ